MSTFPNEKLDTDLKRFIEVYGEDVYHAVLKMIDGVSDEDVERIKEEYGDEDFNKLKKLIAGKLEGEELRLFINEYEEFYNDFQGLFNKKVASRKNLPGTPYKKGDFIGQKYEVHDVLGMGGFGIVYLVYSHETKSVYALKTFRDEYLEDTQTRDRFRKEAQVWIDMERHPYLVRAHFVDEVSGRLFIAAEYIAPDEEGLNSLDGYLKRRPPDVAQSLKWGIQFCHGMEYAYSKGIRAHRDIKPANIMIGQDRSVKISDFGLAGVIGQARISGIKLDIQNNKVGFSCQTMEGSGFGTPTHMPPEQFTNAAACDERSDIYSFGIVLYQMSTGGDLPFLPKLPRNEEEHKQFWHDMHKLHSEAPVPRLDSPLFPIIQRCLEKEPNRRYRSFIDLRADLEPILKRLTGEVVKLPEQKELEAWEWSNKGSSLDKLGQFDEAIRCYDKALEIDSHLSLVWNNKGLSLTHLRQFDAALACFEKSIKYDLYCEKPWLNKGNIFRESGLFKEALSSYEQALRLKPNMTEAMANKGAVLHLLGRYEDAVHFSNKAVEKDPKDFIAWANKGKSLCRLGNHKNAIECYEKAINISPLNEDLWLNKGECLTHIGNFSEAIKCYDKIISFNPRYAYGWREKGNALSNLKCYEDAILCYENELRLNPKDIAAVTNKANCLLKLNRYDLAIVTFGEALELDQKNINAWINKGTCLSLIGNKTEALGCFDQALALNGRELKALFNKATIEEEIGNINKAIFCFKRFIELATNEYSTYISYAQERIKKRTGGRNV